MKSLISLSALFLGPSAEPASELQRVDTGDMTIEYRSSRAQDGSLVLAGRETRSGKTFRFRVSKGWVRGTVDGQRVTFRVPETPAGS